MGLNYLIKNEYIHNELTSLLHLIHLKIYYSRKFNFHSVIYSRIAIYFNY